MRLYLCQNDQSHKEFEHKIGTNRTSYFLVPCVIKQLSIVIICIEIEW